MNRGTYDSCLVPGCNLKRDAEGLCSYHLGVTNTTSVPGKCASCGVKVYLVPPEWRDAETGSPHACGALERCGR